MRSDLAPESHAPDTRARRGTRGRSYSLRAKSKRRKPPIVVLVVPRREWLAHWSRIDAASPQDQLSGAIVADLWRTREVKGAAFSPTRTRYEGMPSA